jgi:hypothetical protein
MTEFLDRPPAGWFALDVMKESRRKWDWCALMIDVHPDEYRLGNRKAGAAWVRIPCKHRSRDAACDALQDMMETRH